jgi:6-pyruvoyltetrahydropterin/6-carboxytetrahydropterin synthase
MKWVIDKSFDFCYGHRVHNQRLDSNFTESGDTCLACRHIHGHQGQVKVFLTSNGDNVKNTGMVTDFKHLGWFKNFLDDTLDHKFIMDIEDPLFKSEFPLCKNLTNVYKMKEGFHIPNLTEIYKLLETENLNSDEFRAIQEKYEGAVFVDFVPTSENLCAWLLEICQKKMSTLPGVEVVAVEFWETPKSHCRVQA